MQTVNTDAKKYGFDLAISEWKAGKYLEALQKANPNIHNVFQKGVEKCLKDVSKLTCPLLIKPNGEKQRKGRERTFYDRWSNELIKEACAEIPQHTVSNQTKFAGIRIKHRIPGVKVILEGHDALLFQIPKEDVENVAKIAREEFERPIDFNKCSFPRDYELIIPAEFEIGVDSYKHMEKLEI